MKHWMAAAVLAVVCWGVYHPQNAAQFVLDDQYTVVRNPLIKNPSLYKDIWTSRLFDAHRSSGYIKFGYYRPVLQSSWILDYRLFGLKAAGYQWMNLWIHAVTCFLIYLLFFRLFGRYLLALKSSLLFCVFPTQEWVVRYVTGRGDELSALFALLSLIAFLRFLRTRDLLSGVFFFLCWVLSALTREVAISYIFFAVLIYSFLIPLRGHRKRVEINRFCSCWVLIGVLPFVVIWPIIPKLGNVLALHLFYLASAGLCLWLAQLRSRWFVLFFILCAGLSSYQGQFWTTENSLLLHTRSLEFQPRTAVAQQLLMKFEGDIPGIRDMIAHSDDPMIKAMWLRRLGVVYFGRGDLVNARQFFLQALAVRPQDVDALNALAVVDHDQGREAESLSALLSALKIDPDYPDTLRTLGIHFYINKDFSLARTYLSRCLEFEPDNQQARDLLRLANSMN